MYVYENMYACEMVHCVRDVKKERLALGNNAEAKGVSRNET